MFASRSKLMMVALFLVALSFGCSSINQQIGLPEDISGVTGQDISMVTDMFGCPPTRVDPDGNGGSIYVWDRWEKRPWGVLVLWRSTFWVDSKGTIYKWN
jgi:hypothetical protein